MTLVEKDKENINSISMMNVGRLSLLRKLPHSPGRLRQMSRCLPVITEIIKDRLRDRTLHPW